MPESRCLNCQSPTGPAARFCAACGQRTDTARLTFGDIVRDLMQRFVNVERGPLSFARALLARPGHVARAYVEGQRRRYYGPFATLVVLVGLTALAVNWSGYQVMAHDGLSSGPTDLLQRHFNLLLLAQLPLQGVICALLFRDARLTLPEHMVLVAYTLSVRAVFVALVVPVAFALSVSTPPREAVGAFWAAWIAYFAWACSQFYAGPRWSSWARGAAAAVLGYAATVGPLMAASAIYETIVVR